MHPSPPRRRGSLSAVFHHVIHRALKRMLLKGNARYVEAN